MEKTRVINEEFLRENGYEILCFDPCWLVAFICNDKTVEIFQKNMQDDLDDGHFFTLLFDEVNTIYKAMNNEY